MKDFMPINLASGTLSEMKGDWTKTMQEAIAKAKEVGSESATVTLKTVITLDKMPITTEKDYREATVPKLKWKAGYTVPVTNSRDGEFGGEYELTNDEGMYGLRSINGQVSMFDTEEDEEDLDEDEE